MPHEILIDNWSYFDYKPSFGGGNPGSWAAPSWAMWHFRRLQAYKLLDSYCKNIARMWLLSDGTLEFEDIERRREYGDPNVVVSQIVASLLGKSQKIVIEELEADEDSPFQAQLEVLNGWAKKERLFIKMIESERNTVKFGDGIYVLAWSESDNRPKLQVWDPGFYYPVLPDDMDEEFPTKVHIAWEWIDSEHHHFVRRKTWELVNVLDPRVEDQRPRTHEWNESPTDMTVLFSDGTWPTENLKTSVEDFTEKSVVWDARDIDLNIDFLPIVHVPNSVAGVEHYGVSSLANVVQIFDDLVATDTDLQAASATTGSPVIAITGTSIEKDDFGRVPGYGPGQLLEVGEGGAQLLDTSRSLDALTKYDDNLLSRLSVNSRVPESLFGRIKPSEVPSGIALTISFAPHSGLIDEMRLVRDDKNSLLMKMVTRFFMQNGELKKDQVGEAKVKLGTYLPADQKAATDMVVQLMSVTPSAISLETAVKILVNAGFPIEDAFEEVQRIEARDFEGASQLLDATSDPNLVRGYLGEEPLAGLTTLLGGTEPSEQEINNQPPDEEVVV